MRSMRKRCADIIAVNGDHIRLMPEKPPMVASLF
jgi:hypothetical protein